MSSLVTEETVKNLTEENIRLCEELVFIRERMKMLIEFKIMFDLHSNKIKQSLDSDEWQKFEKILKKINDFAKTRVTKSGNPIVDVNTLPPQPIQPQQEKDVKQNVISPQKPDEKNLTLKIMKVSYVGSEKKEVRTEYKYQPRRVTHNKYMEKCREIHRCRYQGCNKTFTGFQGDYNLRRHVNRVHLEQKNLYCQYPDCPYYTNKKELFDKHIGDHDNYHEVSAQKRTHVCDFEGCGKEFTSKKTWIFHRNKHLYAKTWARKCTHPGCEYIGMGDAQLESHMIKHSDVRPFVCEVDECGKRFKRQDNYKIHLEVHKNKYFKCTFDGCGKTFETGAGLRTHQSSTHIRDKLYSCEWPGCEFQTYSKSSYRGHQTVHSDQTYPCDYPNCSAKYKNVYTLRHHQLKHHGIGQAFERSWPGCDHKAITKNKLKNHEKSHNPSKLS